MHRRKLTPWQRWNLAHSQQYKCAICDNLLEPGWHADHIVRLCDSGNNTISNFQALCVPCHNNKTHDENIRQIRPKKQLHEITTHKQALINIDDVIVKTDKCAKSKYINARTLRNDNCSVKEALQRVKMKDIRYDVKNGYITLHEKPKASCISRILNCIWK